jgi:subtilisin family serine protease
MSVDDVLRVLSNSPDVEIVRKIEPPRVLGLQSIDSSTASVVIANIEPAKAERLSASAQGSVLVEHDAPLSFMLPQLALSTLPNPGVFVPSSTGFSARFDVTGPAGPVADADVQLFGRLFPAKGKTDANGQVTINVVGESPEGIQALYVKPRADHWDLWLRDPEVSTTAANPIRLKPLPMPGGDGQNAPFLGWGERAMGLDRLPENLNGSGVKIAVIDSGAAQTTHRNLRSVGPGISVIGPDANAWVDDEIGHGSHCAGIIGGTVRAGQGGLRGFAPGAEVHICRVFPGGRFSDLISALDYCMENNIDIASMSLGSSGGSQILADRIQQARALGMACIVAAGNSGGSVNFPAFLPSTLAVSAIGKWGEFPEDSFHSQQSFEQFQGGQGFFPASFSCFGPEIDVSGPGVAIISSVPDDGFAAWDGTSMATPHVAGLAALVYAHHPDFRNAFRRRDNARVDRLFEIIQASCRPLPFGPDRVGRGLPWAPAAHALEMQSSTGREVPRESIDALRKLIQLLQPA